MLNSLDALIVAFLGMSVISVLGVVLLFLVKNEKWKKGIFYGLGLWGLVIAYCNLQTTFSYMAGSIFVAGGLGLLAIAGMLIGIFSKKEKSFQLAQVLVAVSVIAGMADTFLI